MVDQYRYPLVWGDDLVGWSKSGLLGDSPGRPLFYDGGAHLPRPGTLQAATLLHRDTRRGSIRHVRTPVGCRGRSGSIGSGFGPSRWRGEPLSLEWNDSCASAMVRPLVH
jgi:hypothetical protein